jgi:hypothetical protein
MCRIIIILFLLISIVFAQPSLVYQTGTQVVGEISLANFDGHIQGIEIDQDTLYMAGTNTIYKYNFTTGDTIKSVNGGLGHQGDLCMYQDTLYCSDGQSIVRRTRELVAIDTFDLSSEVGLAYAVMEYGGNFYVGTTMSADSTINRIYKFDSDFNLLKRYGVATGYQWGGVQCLGHWNDQFYVGCYGPNPATLVPISIFQCDTSFNILNEFNGGNNIGAYGMAASKTYPDSNKFYFGFQVDNWSQYRIEEEGWLPNDIDNLNVWLESDYSVATIDDRITLWQNRGIDGENAYQATATKQPEYIANSLNQKPALRLDGTSDYLDLVMQNLTNYSYFIVAYPTTVSGRRCIIEENSNYAISVENNTTLASFWAQTTTDAGSVSLSSVVANTPYIYTGMYDSAEPNTLTGWRRTGTATATGFDDEIAGTLQAIDGIHIGTYRSANDRFFQGDMYAILIYEDVLTTAEITKVLDYLSHKYGIIDNGTYFVDADDGHDDNDGNSPATALASFDSINTNITLDAGDTLSIKTGTTITADLIIPTSGVFDNQITFINYDSAFTPLFGNYAIGDPPTVDLININSKDYITISACINSLNGITGIGTGFIFESCGGSHKHFNYFKLFKEFKTY